MPLVDSSSSKHPSQGNLCLLTRFLVCVFLCPEILVEWRLGFRLSHFLHFMKLIWRWLKYLLLMCVQFTSFLPKSSRCLYYLNKVTPNARHVIANVFLSINMHNWYYYMQHPKCNNSQKRILKRVQNQIKQIFKFEN